MRDCNMADDTVTVDANTPAPPPPHTAQSQRARPPSNPPPTAHSRAHGHSGRKHPSSPPTQHPPQSRRAQPPSTPPPTAHSRAYGRIRHQYFYLCRNVMLFTLNAGIFSRWASQLKATCIFGDYGHNVALVIFSDTTYITLALSGFASNGQRHRLAYYV